MEKETDDISQINWLSIEVFTDKDNIFSEEVFFYLLKDNLSYVYKDKHLLIALCICSYEKQKDIIAIDVFCLKQEYRRKGLGTSLLNSCINNCIKNGYQKFSLYVVTTNEKAINVYKKIGFKISKKIDNYYNKDAPPDNDAYLMVLDKTNNEKSETNKIKEIQDY